MGFEVDDEVEFNVVVVMLDELGYFVYVGMLSECVLCKVKVFIGFKDLIGNYIELVVWLECSGKCYFVICDVGIIGFSYVGLFIINFVRDELFWI